MNFTALAKTSFFATVAIATGAVLLATGDADAKSKKKHSGYHSGYGVTISPAYRQQYGTRYNFTTWDRDTRHEGYGKRYGDHFRYHGRTPTVDYYDYDRY